MSWKHVFTTGSQTGKENLHEQHKGILFCHLHKERRDRAVDAEGTQMISEYPLTPCIPFLCSVHAFSSCVFADQSFQ